MVFKVSQLLPKNLNIAVGKSLQSPVKVIGNMVFLHADWRGYVDFSGGGEWCDGTVVG